MAAPSLLSPICKAMGKDPCWGHVPQELSFMWVGWELCALPGLPPRAAR